MARVEPFSRNGTTWERSPFYLKLKKGLFTAYVKVEEKICMNESTTNWSCFDKKWYFRSDFLALNEF